MVKQVIPLTLTETLKKGKEILTKAGVENPAFDTQCLFTKCFSLDKQALLLHGDKTAPEKTVSEYINLITKRAQGHPLQYLLRQWEFLGLPIKVGEGVLIPRPETELLCEVAANWLKSTGKTKVLDLCGGSGAVAIGIAHLCPTAEIISAELSDTALFYLNENIKLNNLQNVKAIKADVLNSPEFDTLFPESLTPFDAIVSNPPYIPTGELEHLQAEVKHEPKMALDGGSDGLDFYRAICRRWLTLLTKGGLAAFEIGQGQSDEVTQIMSGAGLTNITATPDYSGIERIIHGTLK